MPWIEIPALLRTLTKEQWIIEASGQTLLEVIDDIERRYPGFKERIVQSEGLNRFVLIFLDDEDVRYLTDDPLRMKIPEGSTIKIIPQVAGG